MEAEETRLIKLDTAQRALAEARTLPDVKQIRDTAAALQQYAKQQAYSLEIQNQAAEIKLRAERKAGELLRAMEKAKGASKPGTQRGTTRLHDETASPTLADLGISKSQSHRWQLEASLPETVFETYVADGKTTGRELSSRAVLDLAKQHVRQTEQQTRQAQTTPLVTADGAFYTNLKALVQAVQTGQIPPFRCLYVDPPWLYDNQATRGSTANHYPTMTLSEIVSLPIEKLVAPQCHLHLWTTTAFLPEGLRLLQAWGFAYKGKLTWMKPEMGLGNYWRNTDETLLLGVRGGLLAQDHSIPSVHEVPRAGHSVKPEYFRMLVERLSPSPYLELFGRRLVEGWMVWGNERDDALEAAHTWTPFALERRRLVEELGYPTLANWHTDTALIRWAQATGRFVRIDRPSKWGNQFELWKDGDRYTVVAAYATHYLPHKPSLLAALPELEGKVLACWCVPDLCHGEVLLRELKLKAWQLLDEYMQENGLRK
jgi:N6-adenosine-specific RNA methylase IME4